MKKMLVPILATLLTQASVCPLPVLAESVYPSHMDGMADGVASLDAPINVPGGGKKVSIAVTGENVRSVLHQLAETGGFNLVMDESVTGNVTVELTKVTVNQALQAVAALSDIMVVKQPGGIYLAMSRQAAQDKGIARQLSKVIKIYYSNANRVADILNKSIFASSASGGSSSSPQKAKAESRTNSLIVVGTAREIQLAEAAVAKLDVPRQSKTFYLSHANALDVATMISSSIFNDGTASLSMGGGSPSSSSSGSGASATASALRVEKEDVQEGTGINNIGGGSSSGGGISAGLSSSVTLRGMVKSTDTLQVSPEGALVIPDTRQNAVTIMGTAEQIAAAEALIPTLDAQLPQVAIEASLVEISSTGVKELSGQLGVSDSSTQMGFNNQALAGVTPTPGLPASVQAAGKGLIGLPTVDSSEQNPFSRTGISISSNPLARNKDYLFQIRSLMTENKAKILANPTVVATHDTESIISIVDEVIRGVTTQLDPSGFATQTVEIGEAGIVLDILPKIGEDGTISMRLRPSVTTVRSTQVLAGNVVTLLSKRDLLTQNVRVRDGETIAIGGLINETDTTRVDKMPGLGDTPILGALFRATERSGKRSELVLLITPHIMNSTKLTPVNATSNMPVESSMAGGSQ